MAGIVRILSKLTKDQNDDQKKTMDIISNLHAYLKDIYQKQNAIEDGADRISPVRPELIFRQIFLIGGVQLAGL